jgi:hypothetical protein
MRKILSRMQLSFIEGSVRVVACEPFQSSTRDHPSVEQEPPDTDLTQRREEVASYQAKPAHLVSRGCRQLPRESAGGVSGLTELCGGRSQPRVLLVLRHKNEHVFEKRLGVGSFSLT